MGKEEEEKDRHKEAGTEHEQKGQKASQAEKEEDSSTEGRTTEGQVQVREQQTKHTQKYGHPWYLLWLPSRQRGELFSTGSKGTNSPGLWKCWGERDTVGV